ncbi:MAG: SRPBCC family protein [Collimonas sp.]|uniref:SRPBCC family protein n=1 Tax=Collimonas sp. TaxID=1963772 RepID=UPI0032655A8C
MWTHEESIETSAAPARVWELLANVARWKDWNTGIESIELHGPFVADTTFTMRPPGQDALTSTLVEVKNNESFIDETVVDDTRVLVNHRLVLLPSGRTRIVYSTGITGPGAAEFGPMVTHDFPDVLAALKKLAEQS